MEEMDRIIIEQILGKTSDNTLIKACSLIIHNKPEDIDIEEIKLTGRAKDLYKFASEYQEAKKPKYAIDNYFPLNDISYSVSDFENHYTKLNPQERIKVAFLLKEHGGDGIAIRYYTGDKKLLLNEKTLQKMATAALEDTIHLTALKALNTGNWKAIQKVAEFLETTGDNDPIHNLFSFGLKKEATTVEYPFEVVKKALGETAAKQLFKNGKLDQKMYAALPKPDKVLIDKYNS